MSQTHNLWRFFLLLLITSLIVPLGIPAESARAQGTGYVTITNPDTSKFPTISTYLDAFDDQGQFITDLATSEVTVIENGKQVTSDTLESLHPPLSFVLAINSEPALSVRDGFGYSRYDKVVSALNNWVKALPTDSPDKLALVWNGGVVASRLGPTEWNTRLGAFDPALRTSKTSLSALAFALDAAQEAESGSGIKKSILLISAHLNVQDQTGIHDLITRAKLAGVRVYVWITDSRSFQENPGALVLQDLALETGGRYAAFTGSETLPDMAEWLSPLRNNYKLTYSSEIRQGGTQTLTVTVNNGSQALTSTAVNFTMDLQPPSVTLLSPPIQIVRQNPEDPFDIASFTPTRQEISALVEFPDGLPRSLKRTTLYVDGQKISENTREPFTRFNWDLNDYAASADHVLQVEVEDSLGLSQTSTEVPVQVTVVQPPGGMAGLILRNRTAVTITIMVLAGSVALSIIVLGGRKTLSTLAERRKKRAAQLDPLTQPVPGRAETAGAPRANPFPWLRRKTAPPPAYFVKLTSDGAPSKGDPISLIGPEITFGTDPTQATNVLDHPSLSALHARLHHAENDIFTLLDQNSVAGTWVNYDPIPLEGRTLKHGDVVHFGRLTYRFVLTKPPAIPKPTITPN